MGHITNSFFFKFNFVLGPFDSDDHCIQQRSNGQKAFDKILLQSTYTCGDKHSHLYILCLFSNMNISICFHVFYLHYLDDLIE